MALMVLVIAKLPAKNMRAYSTKNDPTQQMSEWSQI